MIFSSDNIILLKIFATLDILNPNKQVIYVKIMRDIFRKWFLFYVQDGNRKGR